jgi:hypothetical protein
MGEGSCHPPAPGDEVVVIAPAAPAYVGVALEAVQAMAELAGLGPHAAGRARLIAEEIFLHIAGECRKALRRESCRLGLTMAPDGLRLCFKTRFLAYDPDRTPEYSLQQVLAGGSVEGLGLHLVRTYARDITLTRKGADRELCLLMTRQEGDYGSRPWSRLVPELRPGLNLSPMEHQGRLLHRLEDAEGGKTYLARALAHVALSLIDGRKTFAWIMGRALKVLPDQNRHAVEDLFEVLIEKGLVSVRELAPPQPSRVRVRRESEPETKRVLDAYQKILGDPK